MNRRCLVALMAFSLGCKPAQVNPVNILDTDAEANVPPANGVVDDPFAGLDSDPPDETGATTETDAEDTDDTDVDPPTLPTVDCANLPDSNWGFRPVAGVEAYHGIVFDGLGNIFGNSNGVLYQADHSGAFSIAATGLGTLEQMDILPNGDIVAASQRDGLVRIAPNGSVSFLADVNSVYGLRVGPDGMVYTANQSRMHRVDPNTGDVDIFLPPGGGFVPKVFDWTVDFSQMIIGTNQSGGKLWIVDLDANYDPISDPVLFAPSVGESWHDAVAVDICGNIYVAEFWSGGLYKVSPDGQTVTRLISTGGGGSQYGHGITWGSGVGGWPLDHIYLPQPYNSNSVIEMGLGVPYRTYTGPVINRP